MAIARFTPYVSEFEYASRFHPSRNPDCSNRWSGNFGSRRSQRSSEEKQPVDQEPSIEVRAILVRCPKIHGEKDDILMNREIYNITAGRSQNILDFHGFDRDESDRHSEVRDCRRKLVITMKFNNIGKTKTQEEFVVIDHVLDPVTMHKARLLNPFVVKVRQEPVLQLYGLKFQGVVNAEATEEVINKKMSNYTGCDADSENPTCGQMFFEGKPIPYSQGFCCSCDPEINIQREAVLLNESFVSTFPSSLSKSRERLIRPAKSPRNANRNSYTSLELPESYEIDNVRSHIEVKPEDEEKVQLGYESLDNSNYANSYQKFDQSDSNHIGDSYDYEKDLKDLKVKGENLKRVPWQSVMYNKDDSKKKIEPDIHSIRQGSLRVRSNYLGSRNKKRKTLVGARRNSLAKDIDRDIISEFQRSGKEMFSYYKPTEHSYVSSLKNPGNVNLTAELMKLEDEYKNFQISSIMRAEGRKSQTKDKTTTVKDESANTSVGKYSTQRSNDDKAKKFPLIGSPEPEILTAIGDHRQERILAPTLAQEIYLPVEEGIQGRGSTLKFDINLFVRSKQKPSKIIDQTHATKSIPNVVSSTDRTLLKNNINQAIQFFETNTPAILRQQLVSDRVYPSSTRTSFAEIDKKRELFHSYTIQTTAKFDEAYDSEVADLLANVVMSDETEESMNHSLSNDNRQPWLEAMYNATSPENSITAEQKIETQSTVTSVDGSTTSFYKLASQVESSTNSSSSFSSGNLSKRDAILLSGSLKNQLANWILYDKWNTSEMGSDREKFKKDSGEVREVQFNNTVGFAEPVTASSAVDNFANGHVQYEDQWTGSVDDRNPVKIYLRTNNENIFPSDKADETSIVKSESLNDYFSKNYNISLAYPRNREERELVLNNKFENSNVSRSYRSIADDDSLLGKDNDRQKHIDKQIKDEFQEISDALKEAANGPKVSREKLKNGSSFEKDNSVERKFAQIFNKIPKEKTNIDEDHLQINDRDYERTSDIERDESKLQSNVIKHTEAFIEPVSEIAETIKPKIIVDRFKIINDFQELPDNYKQLLHLKENTNRSLVSTTTSNDLTLNNNTLFPRPLQPAPIIENLKKELRKEAERYSSIPTSSLRMTNSSDSPDVIKHAALIDQVREANMELTPVEKLTELTPDEETKYTIAPFSKSTNLPTTVNTIPINELRNNNENILPRVPMKDFEGCCLNEPQTLFSKSTNKILILLEEFSTPSFTSNPYRGDKREHKTRVYRHQQRRNNLNKRRLIKNKLNISGNATTIGQVFSNEKRRNEDYDHHWYDMTTKVELSVEGDTNFRSIVMMKPDSVFLKSMKRGSYHEIPTNTGNTSQYYERLVTGSPHRLKLSDNTDTTTKAGLTFEDLSKIMGMAREKSKLYMDAGIAKEDSAQVDDVPIFQRIHPLNISNELQNEKPLEIAKSELKGKLQTSIGRTKRNLQTLSSSKFRSDYPRRNEIISRFESEDLVDGTIKKEDPKNSKRNGVIDFNDSEQESLIFYDYDEGEVPSVTAGRNYENKRIRDSSDHDEFNNISGLKKYRRVTDESNEQFPLLENPRAIGQKNVRNQSIMKRSGSMLHNYRADDRPDTEESSMSVETSQADNTPKNFETMDLKERGGNCSRHKFGIETSLDWKRKMELLKLKKHSDVLKEYLNWRQDVVPPDSQSITGNTTKISLMNTKQEQITDLLTTDTFNVSDEITLATTITTYSTTLNDLSTTIDEQFTVTELRNSSNETYITNKTTISNSVETTAIFPVKSSNHSGNCSSDELSATDRIEILTACVSNNSEGCIRYDEEASTGRILPPCGFAIQGERTDDEVTTRRTEFHQSHNLINQSGVTELSSDTSRKVTSNREGELSDIDNDLVIISLIEKNRLTNKKADQRKDRILSSKAYRFNEDVAHGPNTQHRRLRKPNNNFRTTSNYKTDKLRNYHRTGRRLMSVKNFYDVDEYDRDLPYVVENNYVDSSDEDPNTVSGEQNHEKLKHKWNELIDRIINVNSSHLWKSGNSTNSSLTDIPGDSRSAMQQLHFYDADKYIRKISKEIVHNANINDPKHETETLDDKNKSTRHKVAPSRHQRGNRHIAVGRKLENYPRNGMTSKKVLRNAALKNHENFEKYESTGSNINKRSSSRLKKENCYNDRPNSSALQPSSALTNADVYSSLFEEISEQGKAGRDFEISLRGNIHVEGGINGKPMSISFDTSPDIPNINGTMLGSSNETVKSDNTTSRNFLARFFNIGRSHEDFGHNSSGNHSKASNLKKSVHQSARDLNPNKIRSSRENHRKSFSGLKKKLTKTRKSRAVDTETAERLPRHRGDRSYELDDLRDSEEVAEESDSEDYPESSYVHESYSDFDDDYDFPITMADRKNQHFRIPSSEIETISSHHHRSLDSPDVKVIKIIPLKLSKSSESISMDNLKPDYWQKKKEDTKASRMTASQLPKMEEDYTPGTTVKPGKIKPAGLPWQQNENENEDNPIVDFHTVRYEFPTTSSESCALTKSSQEIVEKPDKSNESPIDRHISTSNPMNLKVIGFVSMEEPSKNEVEDSNINSNGNYKIVPSIHVTIEQQTEDTGDLDHNYIRPLHPEHLHILDKVSLPPVEDCQEIELSNSPQNCHNGLCSPFKNEKHNGQVEDNTHEPKIITINMDNDEELREPIQIGSCQDSNRTDTGIIPDYEDDNKFDHTRTTEGPRLTEKIPQCEGHQDMTTISETNLHKVPNRFDRRKNIRMKNMLAIMKFMQKIQEIMSGGQDSLDLMETNNNGPMIKLNRIIVLPNNQSIEISGRPKEPEVTTERVVIIGEGVNHESPPPEIPSIEEHFRLSENREFNDTTNYMNAGNKSTNARPLNNSVETNRKPIEKDRNKSFLFYGRNNKLGGSNESVVMDVKDHDFRLIDRDEENGENHSNDEIGTKGQSVGYGKVHKLNTQLFEKLNNTENSVSWKKKDENNFVPKLDIENSFNTSAGNQSVNSARNEIAKGNLSKSKNSGFNIDKSMLLPQVIQRKAVEVDSSSIPKLKRHRSPIRSRSNRINYGLRDQRDARRQIYRTESLPTSNGVSRFSNRKFGRYAAVKGIPKRKKTKKKKKRRRKKKKKKGKVHRAVKGKAWWPFGRQLMSVSENRELILDSNFDQIQVERVKREKNTRRGASFPGEQRKRRRVHRAKHPHGKRKKMKRRRKYKKGRKNKKRKKANRKRVKRQIRPGGTQVRGGQDCMDRRHPSNVNPSKYLESAHCLRFSDLWYSVYELENPIMEHTVYLQLFEKHNLADGTSHWDDLTQGTMVRIGTFTRHQRDDKPTIVFTYNGAKIDSQKRVHNLDPAKEKLLVPSPVAPKIASKYPEVRGESGEYLVVQANTISKDGNECDKAGVGFRAFSKQENRCGRMKGSCLKNQPLAYWRHDMEARESGRPGCYFLSNFATVPTNPIKYNVSGSGSQEYLGLEYHSAHVSTIDIEVRTDYNAIVRVGSSGRVTEVYVDSTALEHTVVTVVISNMGLASSPYQPRITDCPTGLPVSWTKAKGIMQVIPPQHDQRVTLDLYGQLLLNGFHCSVEVVNHRGELVAMRRIRVQKMDRCFCVWHCLCACIGAVSGMGCQPMSPEHYHAAGFQGPVPVVTSEASIVINAVEDVLMFSALIVLLLLLLGFLKWVIGMFLPSVARWGLDSLLESNIEEYFEAEFRGRCVVTDDEGAIVHPDTGQRTVRICTRKVEFVLNLIFFLTYPIAMCCNYFKKSLQASRQRYCCPDESKMCLINEKSSCPKMICVSTYGDSRNSKLEAEDTRYVMNELKKSQESLQNLKRTNVRVRERNRDT